MGITILCNCYVLSWRNNENTIYSCALKLRTTVRAAIREYTIFRYGQNRFSNKLLSKSGTIMRMFYIDSKSLERGISYSPLKMSSLLWRSHNAFVWSQKGEKI